MTLVSIPFKSPFSCAYSNTIASRGVFPVRSPMPNSDSNARTISVGNVVPTGIGKLNGNAAANWSITNVAGTTIMSGTNATEADILKKAKSQQLKGVFIINMDGAKRKTVIK